MKVFKLSLFLTLLLAAVAGFLYYRRNSFLETVTVGPKWVNQMQFAGIFVAKERGFYSKKGLDVVVKEFTFETDIVGDLTSGKTDFAILSPEEFLLAVDRGAPIKAIASIYQISPNAIVTLKDSGITSPADFKDRLMGNKSGKAEETLVFELLLRSVGLSRDSVTIKNVGFDNTEYEDLIAGSVDAINIYRTDQLYFFKQNGVDYNIIYPEQFGINNFNDVLVTRFSLATRKPELVHAFVEATVKGWEYALENEDIAIEATLKYVTNSFYLDEDYERFIFKESVPLIKPSSTTKIGSMTYSEWEALYKQMVQYDLLEGNFDLAKVVTMEFLP